MPLSAIIREQAVCPPLAESMAAFTRQVAKGHTSLYSMDSARQLTVQKDIFLQQEGVIAQQTGRIAELEEQVGVFEREIEHLRHSLSVQTKRSRTPPPVDGKSSELSTALMKAEAEISAQIRARLELEGLLHTERAQARLLVKAKAAMAQRLKELEAFEKHALEQSAALSQRLSTLRLRNAQLERQCSDIDGRGSTSGAMPAGGLAANTVLDSTSAGPSHVPTAELSSCQHCKRLQQELTKVQGSYKRVCKENHSLQDLSERIRTMEHDKVELQNTNTRLANKASSYESKLGALASALQASQERERECLQRLSTLQSEHADCAVHMKQASSQAQAAHAVAEAAVSQIAMVQTPLKSGPVAPVVPESPAVQAVSATVQRLTGQLVQLEALVPALKAQVEQHKAAAERAHGEIALLSQHLVSERTRCADLAARGDVREASLQAVTEKAATASAHAEGLHAELITARERLSAAEAAKDSLTAHLSYEKAAVSSLKESVYQLQKQVAAGSAQMNAVHAAAQDGAAIRAAHEHQLASVRSELEEQRKEVSTLQERMQSLIESEAQASVRVAMMSTALEQAVRDRDAARQEVDHVREELEAVHASLSMVQGREAALRVELGQKDLLRSHFGGTSGTAQQAEAQRRIAALEARLDAEHQAKAVLAGQVESFEERLAAYKQRLSEAEDGLQRAQAGVQAEKAQHAATVLRWEAYVNALSAEQQATEGALAVAAGRKQELKAEVGRLKAEVARLRSTHGAMPLTTKAQGTRNQGAASSCSGDSVYGSPGLLHHISADVPPQLQADAVAGMMGQQDTSMQLSQTGDDSDMGQKENRPEFAEGS